MIILYKPSSPGVVDPIVILDYTRSDDQYSPAQIQRYVASLGIQAAKGKTINPLGMKVYSLDYSYSFTHSGINYGDSLKTQFAASITNAPIDLISILNIKQYASQENLNSLISAGSSIIDPQVFFPTGAFVLKPNSNSTETITRTFMVYSTPFNFDSRRITSTLIIRGSEYDSMVMRLQFAVNLNKQTPLVSQLTTIFAAQGFVVNYDQSLATTLPKVERYYRPSPINSIMSDVCRDNDITHVLDSDNKTITLKSLNPNDAPLPDTSTVLTFNNYIPGSKLISTFSLQDYASCTFEAEAFDITLFDSVNIYDDSFNEGQFANLSQMAVTIPVGKAILKGHRFYVLEYTYFDSREKTSITVRGTNNWLVSNFKLDAFLENKIYSGQL